MEHILLLILVGILTLLAILLFAHGSNRKWVAGRKQPLPPGSFGWPIIGESIQFISALKTGFGEEFITERAKKYCPHVFKTSVLGDKVVIFPGQAGNKFIFTNEKMLFDPYLPSSMRKLFPTLDFVNLGANKNINSLFKPDSVDKLVASIDSVSKHHLNKYWVGNKEVKAQNLLELYTITVACGAFMGMKDVDQISEFSHHFNILNKGLFTVPYKIPGTPFFRAAKAAEALGRQIGLIVAQKKADMSRKLDSPVQDILSQLLSDGEEPLTEMEMVDKILFFLVSGNVTTTSVITSTMKYLAEYPDLYNEVMKEQMEIAQLMKPREVLCWDDLQKMKYTWNFVSEIMRLLPPVQGNFKEIKTEFSHEGFVIPKGWKVFWNLGVTHKDPQYFSDPLRFKPSRYEAKGLCPYTYVPFGAGLHMCPGREYARVKILVFIHNMIKTFKWKTASPGEKIVCDSVPTYAEGLPLLLSSI